MNIRNTTEADVSAIREVHEVAFGPQAGGTIAGLAIALIHDSTALPVLSLLACDSGVPIGHILFTRVRVSASEETTRAHILAPLAVLPSKQHQGVGTQLVKRGLAILAESGCELVFVLGHPGYYPRHGFRPAGQLGFSAPYPIPKKNADAWMVLELCKGKIGSVHGTVRCADALDKPEHWRE